MPSITTPWTLSVYSHYCRHVLYLTMTESILITLLGYLEKETAFSCHERYIEEVGNSLMSKLLTLNEYSWLCHCNVHWVVSLTNMYSSPSYSPNATAHTKAWCSTRLKWLIGGSCPTLPFGYVKVQCIYFSWFMKSMSFIYDSNP